MPKKERERERGDTQYPENGPSHSHRHTDIDTHSQPQNKVPMPIAIPGPQLSLPFSGRGDNNNRDSSIVRYCHWDDDHKALEAWKTRVKCGKLQKKSIRKYIWLGLKTRARCWLFCWITQRQQPQPQPVSQGQTLLPPTVSVSVSPPQPDEKIPLTLLSPFAAVAFLCPRGCLYPNPPNYFVYVCHWAIYSTGLGMGKQHTVVVRSPLSAVRGK